MGKANRTVPMRFRMTPMLNEDIPMNFVTPFPGNRRADVKKVSATRTELKLSAKTKAKGFVISKK